MNIDKALFALNDACGLQAAMSVDVDRGDLKLTVLVVEGALAHWTAGHTDAVIASAASTQNRGLYRVGDALLDLSELPAGTPIAPVRSLLPDGDEGTGLRITLADDVVISVTWK